MIDFHCHVDLYPSPREIARNCIERDIYVLSVTNTPSAWQGTSSLADGAKRIRTALGLHPQLAHERKPELVLFDKLIPQARYVGEVGLDGAPEFSQHWSDQMLVFTHILQKCEAVGGRVLSIHSRRAAKQVLDVLEEYPAAGKPILHWFSGTARDLSRAIEIGCWFSVGPVMLMSERGQQLVRRMPKDKILTETDGPYATLDGRSVFPWEVDRAVSMLANVWSTRTEDVEIQLKVNLRTLGL
jgi:TatD DNase family protein